MCRKSLFWVTVISMLLASDFAFATTATQTVPIEGATDIEINVPTTIHVLQGDHESMVLSADARDMKSLRIKLEHGVLTLDTADDHNHIYFSDERKVDATVTVRSLAALHLNSAGTVEMSALKSDHLDVGIAGAGSITIKGLQVGTVDMSIAGAGQIEASGSANSVNLHVSGIGGAELAALDSKTTRVSISGGGSVKVAASEDLDATISGFGEVRYRGSPKVFKTISGVGSVEPIGS